MEQQLQRTFRNLKRPVLIGIIGLAVCLVAISCFPNMIAVTETVSMWKCSSFVTISFGPSVPGDAFLNDQTDADCFAWSEFIALNWPTESGTGFGDPGDQNPVQWESYMPKELLFQPGAASPPPWGTQPIIPPDCLSQAQLGAEDATSARLLTATSKFSSDEAAPENAPNWLGAQNGTNVWYEVRVNKDEYDFIVNHEFYDANEQADWVNNGKGQPFVLPAGSSQPGGPVGAIELKAAWMEVPDPQNAKWQKYKLAPAVVVDPSSGACRSTTVALVGLHILHKTKRQPTWIWATFEHVDNAPDCARLTQVTGADYNFYSSSCQPRQIEVPNACLADGITLPVRVSCSSNTSPPYYLRERCPGPVPIQVCRVTAIDSTAQKINMEVVQQITSTDKFPNSVWQYYQLVNVIWSTSPTQDPTVPGAPPRSLSSMEPSGIVANVTMETYVQGDPQAGTHGSTCTDCHQYAAIAASSSVGCQPRWASDFTFVFNDADTKDSWRASHCTNSSP